MVRPSAKYDFTYVGIMSPAGPSTFTRREGRHTVWMGFDVSCGKYTNLTPSLSFLSSVLLSVRLNFWICSTMERGRSVPDKEDSALRRSSELSIRTPLSRSHCSLSVGVISASLMVVRKAWLALV